VALAAAPELQQAQDLYDQLKYAEAAKAVAQARLQPDLTRADLLQALWLQGLCATSMGNPDDARAPWRELAFLDPEFSPTGDLPPKLLTPWYEARGWAASQKKLGFAAKVENGAVQISVQADPLRVVNGARVHVLKGASEDVVKAGTLPQPVPISGATAYWVELIGARGEVLAQLGSAAAPRSINGAAKIDAPPEEHHTPTERGPRLIPGLLGGGAIALALGAMGFGVASSNAKNTYDHAPRLNDGTLYTISQRQAATLRSQHDSYAITANVLFGVAAAAAIAAVLYFVLGPREMW